MNELFTAGLVVCGDNGPCTFGQFLPQLVAIFEFLLKLSVLLAVLGIAAGGIYMIVGAGSPAQREQGKSIVWYSIIGLVCAAAAWLIVNTILVTLGAGGFDNPLR